MKTQTDSMPDDITIEDRFFSPLKRQDCHELRRLT